MFSNGEEKRCLALRSKGTAWRSAAMATISAEMRSKGMDTHGMAQQRRSTAKHSNGGRRLEPLSKGMATHGTDPKTKG